MGFVAGKLAWYLLCPSNFLLLLVAAGGLVGLTGRRWGYRVAWTGFAVLFLVATFPVGEWLRRPLEERFAAPAPAPARVDGVVVLGGGIDPQASAAWVRAHAQELSDDVCARHIALYVNEHSVALGARGRAAIARMLGSG